MNYIKTHSDMVNLLKYMFDVFNCELYDGKLSEPVIYIGSLSGKQQKSRFVSSAWRNTKQQVSEIMFSASFIGGNETTLDDICVEMLHCMVHQYCFENGIKETSNGGFYHNGRFNKIAEAHGLKSRGGKAYRDNKRGYVLYTVKKSAIPKELLHQMESKFFIHSDAYFSCNKKPSSTRKLICPSCGLTVRATKEVYILCGICMERMVEVSDTSQKEGPDK